MIQAESPAQGPLGRIFVTDGDYLNHSPSGHVTLSTYLHPSQLPLESGAVGIATGS